ncbi:MAG TPA: OmpA family protein [Candidatus Eremiobacteraceae bacterium]|nr:OmpA family protein [Candidatus Eremiobacteraceae bacterium]
MAVVNGTIIRSYPPGTSTPGSPPEGAGDVTQGWALADNAPPPPFVFVFELPGVAKIDRFAIHPYDVPTAGGTVTLAVSQSSEQGPFTNVGSVGIQPDANDPTVVQAGVSARWIRMTIDVNGTDRHHQVVNHLEAFGTLAPRPAGASLAGYYGQLKVPYPPDATRFDASVPSDAALFVVTQSGSSANSQTCNQALGWSEASAGTFDGRAYETNNSDWPRHWVLNDEGTMLNGTDNGALIHLVRLSSAPPECKPVVAFNGRHNVVVIENPAQDGLYPYDLDQNPLPAYRFTRLRTPQLDSSMLSSTDTVVMNMLCDPAEFLDKGQEQALLTWLGSGNKLIIHDSDKCEGTTDYSFLPYRFTTNNPGPEGAHSSLFIVLENDSLGSSDASDQSHYLDKVEYLANGQIGDANIVTTRDPHWCGHLFGANINKVNGFMQMYARYGRGLIIYDGLDHDDEADPVFDRIVGLELEQPAAGDLPCTRPVAVSLVMVPDQLFKFAAGQAQTVHADLNVYASQSWTGHVAMSAAGQLNAAITPTAFDLSGGSQTLHVAIDIPASTRAGTYPIIFSASPQGALPAQATITLEASASMANALLTQRRVRLYGIHFDYDSAHIQPQSEPVIAQIAQVMQANPSLRLRVEGYTDSDGGAAYNLDLSQRRAASVVADLVTRYHIANSRLVPRGFGMADPVASNSTAAGKALNRRVELVRL